MAEKSNTNSDLAYADTLWKAADALRGQVDAAEYKHVVLGLLFLKYISDSFEARRDELKAELEADNITGKQLEGLLENRDEYTAERDELCNGGEDPTARNVGEKLHAEAVKWWGLGHVHHDRAGGRDGKTDHDERDSCDEILVLSHESP